MRRNIIQCFRLMREFAFRNAIRYAAFSILSALSAPLLAILIERCINTVTGAEENQIWASFIMLAVLLLASVLLGHLLRVASLSLTETLNKNCSPKIIDKLNHMDYAYFDDASAADVMERVSREPAQALAQIYKTFISCISLAVRIFGLSLLFFKLSAVFGISLCVLMVIEILIGIVSNKEFGRLYGKELPQERKLSYIGNLLTQKGPVFDLKINQSAGYVKKIRKALADSVLRERVGINLKAERWYLLNILLTMVWTVSLLFALITGRLKGTLELGTFCTLLGSYPLLTQYQAELSYYLSSMGKDWFIVKALKELFNYKEACKGTEIAEGYPKIAFSHVSFKYPGTEHYVLRDVSFTLSPGETISLVGPNGSGKSTIIKLICGLYEPTEGTVTVGDVAVNRVSRIGGKQLFSAVFQDFMTYSVAIAENIGLGDIQGSHNVERIEGALKNAEMDRFVSSLPKGVDTTLGHLDEGGIELSGGQRQRLALARAYLSNAWFYLLDEPTAAMDPVAESQLYQSFAGIIHGRGAVLVSHRLASASIADRILVLCDGEIIQRGTHSELMKSTGLYREMFEKQSSWYREAGGGNEN